MSPFSILAFFWILVDSGVEPTRYCEIHDISALTGNKMAPGKSLSWTK